MERSVEMTRLRRNCLVVLVLCGLPALGGCIDQEKKKALADLQTAEAALAGANRDLAAARGALATAQKERDSLQKELQDLKGRNEVQRKQIDKLTADIQASELQREQLRKQVDQLASEMKAVRAQNEQLKKQLARAGEAARQSEDLKTKAAALEEDLAQRMVQIQSLQKEIAELQAKLDAALKPPATPAP
jgi:chromosome segregation ATPase